MPTSLEDIAGPQPLLDLETSLVQSQIGCAVLDMQGHVVRGQGISDQDAEIIFQMLLEVANLRDVEDFRRMTIAMANTRYVVARDGTHVYIVQTTA
jgi:hypothetical protein